MPDLSALPVLWRPHPGFQTRFVGASEREVLGGGAAGPGKTSGLIFGALRYINEPWCRVLFLRGTYPQLQQAMDRTHMSFPQLGATWSATDRRWTFPSGATYKFAAAERLEDLIADHQGSEYTEIAWDELGLVADAQMWSWIKTRCRSDDPRAVIRQRATANPGGPLNAYLRKRFVDPCGKEGGSYMDPETGYSVAYIPGKLADNPTIDGPGRTDYRRAMEGQPESVRRALLEGDWDVGEGLAFPEISLHSHLIPSQDVPVWWRQWGGFDWGFQHWSVFCWLGADETGNRYVIDTLWMRRLQPDQLAESIWESVPIGQLGVIYAGHDCWAEHRARGFEGPTIAQIFTDHGLPLVPADIRRTNGFSLLRDQLSWRGRDKGTDRIPKLRLFDTPGNRKAVDQLMALVHDPHNAEDVLKVDSDPTTGEGGDDSYDSLRYAIATFEREATKPAPDISPFDPMMLALEYERTHRVATAGQPIKPLVEPEASWW